VCVKCVRLGDLRGSSGSLWEAQRGCVCARVIEKEDLLLFACTDVCVCNVFSLVLRVGGVYDVLFCVLIGASLSSGAIRPPLLSNTMFETMTQPLVVALKEGKQV
jgi:hypothetical protein